MLNELLKRYPCLESTREDIIKAENALITCFKNGNKLLICVCVPETETFKVQELHLPVYHYLCARVEKSFFSLA